jgi:hypothetical protein
MHDVVHALLVRPCVVLDAVELERLGRAAAALIERGNETFVGFDLLELILEYAHTGLLPCGWT